MTLKEQFWKDGYIFRMSTNEYRMVWGEKLIDSNGFIPKILINDHLYYSSSTIDEHVIEIFSPNSGAGSLCDLIKPTTEPIWSRYEKIYTMEELKNALGISKDMRIFVLP